MSYHRNTKRMGCPCNSTMNGLPLAYRRFLGNLGDDTGDGGDGGSNGSGGGDGGSGLTTDILSQIDAGTYQPSPTDTFSQAQPGTTVAPSSTFDQFGGVDIGGGAYINSYGDQIMPDGTVYMTDGWTLNADGSVTDPSNQTYPASTPTAQTVAQSAASRSSSGGGGSSSSPGAPKGGGGGSGSSNLQQALCMLNPTLAQCRTQQPAATPAKPASTSSFTSFITQWGGWIAAGVAAAVILPPLLDSGGGRR